MKCVKNQEFKPEKPEIDAKLVRVFLSLKLVEKLLPDELDKTISVTGSHF